VADSCELCNKPSGFRKRWGFSSSAEQLSASQEGFCPMEVLYFSNFHETIGKAAATGSTALTSRIQSGSTTMSATIYNGT
jgi:hypothetical protein